MSLFNLAFFHIFPIFSLFNLHFFCIFQIFSLSALLLFIFFNDHRLNFQCHLLLFYISCNTEIILERLRYITKYQRTLAVSPGERYDFLVSICPVSLVSCRWLNSRGVEQWLQCRLPKSLSSFGDTFDAPRPWTAIRLSGFWRRPCNGHWGLWFYGVFLDETDSERCTWR